MPKVKCPLENCDYETPELSDTIVAALITAHSTIHNQGNNKSQAEKIKRPTISNGVSNEEWTYFLSRWDNYKTVSKICEEEEEAIQLLECLDEDLRKTLSRSVGDNLKKKKATELLKDIKSLCVQEENILIARIDLHSMTQEHDEPIRTYVARYYVSLILSLFCFNKNDSNSISYLFMIILYWKLKIYN